MVLSNDTKLCSAICGDEDEDGEPGDFAKFGEHAVNKNKTTILKQRMKIFDFTLVFNIISFI
jgi:hypothetical protein